MQVFIFKSVPSWSSVNSSPCCRAGARVLPHSIPNIPQFVGTFHPAPDLAYQSGGFFREAKKTQATDRMSPAAFTGEIVIKKYTSPNHPATTYVGNPAFLSSFVNLKRQLETLVALPHMLSGHQWGDGQEGEVLGKLEVSFPH